MSSLEAPKSRCMVGIATLTMVVSSTDMNMPTISTSRGTSQPLPAALGALAAPDWGEAVMTSMWTLPPSESSDVVDIEPGEDAVTTKRDRLTICTRPGDCAATAYRAG